MENDATIYNNIVAEIRPGVEFTDASYLAMTKGLQHEHEYEGMAETMLKYADISCKVFFDLYGERLNEYLGIDVTVEVLEECTSCGGLFKYPHLCREHMVCGMCHPPVKPPCGKYGRMNS